jgi:predicted enzyme related to lactoylglutathione lyase
LQIPAVDVGRSADFYEAVFGWRIERPHPSCEAPGLIGQWVTDRTPTADGGLLAWINVERIDKALELVLARGGEILSPPQPDGTRVLATIRDNAGNAIGIAQHGSS